MRASSPVRLSSPSRALAVLALVLAALAGCAARPPTPELARVEPDRGFRWQVDRDLPSNDPHTLLILTFSGGGTRAAAFSYGVLEELRRTPVGAGTMLSEVDLMTGTSGGSFTALAYMLYGERLFDVYEHAFLKRDVEGTLLRRLANPLTWPKVLSETYGRSELAEDYYDEILFNAATFGDVLESKTPRAIVGATDVTTGLRVNFWQTQFDLMCVDLSGVRLSRAAAASSAVPVVLSPVTFDNRGGTCGYTFPPWALADAPGRDGLWWPTRLDLRVREMKMLADGRERPYLHLVDGGLSDNLGLYSVVQFMQELLNNARMRSMEGLSTLRRVAIVIVNARSAPRLDFDRRPSGPSAFALLMQSVSVPMNRYSTEAVAALQDIVTEWKQAVALARDQKALGKPTDDATLPDVEFSIVDVSFDAVADPARRQYLQNLPTSFALTNEQVDRLRESAAEVLRASPAYRAFVDAVARDRRQ